MKQTLSAIIVTLAFNTLLLSTTTFSLVSLATPVQDPVETSLVKHIDEEMAQALTLLQKAVNINSGTMNFEGVRQVGELFRKEFDSLGFKTEWVEGAAFNRAGHLVASYGNQGPRLLLIGHLDTVFPKDSPFQRYKQNASKKSAKGPGVIDMKGGDVVIIHALRALKAAGVLDKLSVRVVMTGDEEKRGEPMALATKALIDAARWADIAIGFEDGDGDPTTAVVSRRSASGWTLEVSGKPAHSSQIFREDIGDGAIFEAARILNAFRETLSSEPNLTFNPGLIVGGTETRIDAAMARATAAGKDNVIAQTAWVGGDIRALSPEQLAMAQKKMREIVAASLPHTRAKLEFDEGYPPMEPSAGNRKLLALYNEISQDLGFGPVKAVDPRRAGAADISFTAAYVDMAIDGLGLMGDGGHTVDETADLATLPQQTKRAALLMYRLATGGK